MGLTFKEYGKLLKEIRFNASCGVTANDNPWNLSQKTSTSEPNICAIFSEEKTKKWLTKKNLRESKYLYPTVLDDFENTLGFMIREILQSSEENQIK